MKRQMVNFIRFVVGMNPVSTDLEVVPLPIFNSDIAPGLAEKGRAMKEQMGKRHAAAPGSTFKYTPSGASVLPHNR